MKQKTSSVLDRLRHKFPPVPLFRSDVEDILRIAESRKLAVNIADDNYEFESLDDLREHRGNRVKKLLLVLSPQSSSYSSMGIEIDEDGVSLWASKDDAMLPTWHDIKAKIETRLPWYGRFMKPMLWFYVAWGFLWLSNKRELFREGLEWLTLVWSCVSVLFLLVSLGSIAYLHRSRGIHLQREHEVLGFWERNGEKIAMLVLGTVLGVIGKIVSDTMSAR